MAKLEYKPIAIQNECLGGIKKNPEMYIFVKYEAEGRRTYYKTGVMAFPNKFALNEYLEETKLPVISEKKFKQLKTIY